MTARINLLAWDSEFFGVTIARLAAVPEQDALGDVDAECRDLRVDCLYALVDADHREQMQAMEDRGYRMVDIRMTLACSTPGLQVPSTGGVAVRPARASDVMKLEDIARVSHRDGRFHADHRFDRSRCDELYATWIARSCQDYADAVLVADLDGCAAGYITLDSRDDGTGSIGLFAVAPEARGRGVGGRLVEDALQWFARSGCSRVEVVTQGGNAVAQRIYQKHRFRTCRVQVWFHKWYDDHRKAR
jgi:GNAT superfamily N-acetyltransferase